MYNVDIFEANIVDFFHVSVLGLLRKHFNLLLDTVFSQAEVKQISSELQQHSVVGLTFPSLNNIKFWNGDQWLRFMAISSFVLLKVMQTDSTLKKHYMCWIGHLEWLTVMLKPELSLNEISLAEQMCNAWRKSMLSLFDKNKVATPNFHAILHVFEQAKKYGPPVLYCARPFEHKHATYRGYIENSNNINVESFCMLKEKYVDALNYGRPHLKILAPKVRVKRSVLENDYITFEFQNKKSYGKVTKATDPSFEVLIYRIKPLVTRKSAYHKCFEIHTLDLESKTIPKNHVTGRFSLVHGFINRFEVLDMLKI